MPHYKYETFSRKPLPRAAEACRLEIFLYQYVGILQKNKVKTEHFNEKKEPSARGANQ